MAFVKIRSYYYFRQNETSFSLLHKIRLTGEIRLSLFEHVSEPRSTEVLIVDNALMHANGLCINKHYQLPSLHT